MVEPMPHIFVVTVSSPPAESLHVELFARENLGPTHLDAAARCLSEFKSVSAEPPETYGNLAGARRDGIDDTADEVTVATSTGYTITSRRRLANGA